MRLARKLLTVISLSALVISGVVHWNRSQAWCGPAMDDADSIRAKVRELQSIVGLEQWEYDFHLPPKYKLFVILEAEFNGESYPDMSPTYQVVPPWPDDDTNGKVSISFYHPSFQEKIPENPQWTVNIHTANARWGRRDDHGSSFFFVSPFDPSLARTGGGDRSTAQGLLPGHVEEVWEHNFNYYNYPGTETTSQEPYDFTIRMSFRMEELSADDELGSVQNVAATPLPPESTELLPLPNFGNSESQ